MCQCDSHENMKEFVMMSPHVMPHPIVLQIMNANCKHECEPEMQTQKQTQQSQDVHEPRKHHNMSRHIKTRHKKHIFMSVDETIKK